MNIKLSIEIPFNILQLRDNESEATQKEIYREKEIYRNI